MKIQVIKGSLPEYATEAAVVTLFEGETGLDGVAALLDEKSGGLIGKLQRRGDFCGPGRRMRSPCSIPGGTFRSSGSSSWGWEETGFLIGSAAGGIRKGCAAHSFPVHQ